MLALLRNTMGVGQATKAALMSNRLWWLPTRSTGAPFVPRGTASMPRTICPFDLVEKNTGDVILRSGSRDSNALSSSATDGGMNPSSFESKIYRAGQDVLICNLERFVHLNGQVVTLKLFYEKQNSWLCVFKSQDERKIEEPNLQLIPPEDPSVKKLFAPGKICVVVNMTIH